MSSEEKQTLIKYLDRDGNHRINYLELLESFSVQHAEEPMAASASKAHQVDRPSPKDIVDDLVETICCVLVCEYGLNTIRELLQHVVPKGSRRCTPEQFRQVLHKLGTMPNDTNLNNEQVDCLISSIDVPPDGDFDFVEFLES